MATSIQSAHHVRERAAPARAGSIRNHLLALLAAHELEAVLSEAEIVNVAAKQLICRRGEEMAFIYFPHDCVISLVTELEDGSSVEAMTVGCDGFAGMAVFHGLSSSRLTAIGQISGTAHRVPSAAFRRLLDECDGLSRLLHRYSQFVFETVAQSAACNRMHVIEQRCARWLLMSEDRVGRNQFDLTQEFLAEMLGVRRPGVTVAMGALEKAGLIAHGRGRIAVIDRPGLERVACECYGVIKGRQSELLS
ncbi:MAG TPA: Crp/Fnr family transcriptional regulator [Gemmatimonadaceae bacterium]|nr:Crp/Fnr family transcriptional regulator [Gemmatimonadaceae bacterium]